MRLDQYLVVKGQFKSRDRAKDAVLAGQVKVDGQIVNKPSREIEADSLVEVLVQDFAFVSRGGLKLAEALRAFQIDVSGNACLDIGVATGGFSDCLLQAGAKKVYAVDVGEGQLEKSLLVDSRLVFRNQTDARNLQKEYFQEPLDLIVIDVSFISIVTLFDALHRISDSNTRIIALIKPQFEYGKPHGGVIRDEKVLREILEKLRGEFLASGFKIVQKIDSPILGKEGNREFLWLVKV